MFGWFTSWKRIRLEKQMTLEFKEYLDYIENLAKDKSVPLGVIDSHRRAARHIAEVLKLNVDTKKD